MSEVFYSTREFWIGISFLVVVAVLFSPLKKIISSMLIKRINAVVKRIGDASGLEDEARRLLREYEQKLGNVKEEADGILKKSKKEISHFKISSLKEAKRQIAGHERYMDERIENAKNKAAGELSGFITSKTVDALKTAIATKLDDSAKSRLVDASIDFIEELK